MGTETKLDKELLIRWIMDGFRRGMAHYGFWFRDVEYQLGMDFALEVEREAGDLSLANQLQRLSKVLGFELKDGVPAVLYDLDEETLGQLMTTVCTNWLANDGIWFQAVEKRVGMHDAKRCNDTCWTRFSPLEASRIKVLVGLPDHGGLEALKTALSYRLYSRLNIHRIVDEGDNSFVLEMVDCRVQSARKKKNLDDYPCKSAGVAEYRTFAQTIDPRITTECVGCPPDSHPDDWYCAWRFRLTEQALTCRVRPSTF